jgi:type-2 restriction enzyme mboI
MKTNFDLFISQLSETNATLDYFTDFEKVIRNTNKVAIKLNQLNYLIGKEDLRKAIKDDDFLKISKNRRIEINNIKTRYEYREKIVKYTDKPLKGILETHQETSYFGIDLPVD